MYERLLKENEADPAELVISGMSTRRKLIARKVANNIADTVVIFPPERDTAEGGKHEGEVSEILEKPISRQDQASFVMIQRRILTVQKHVLSLMAGRQCEVVTGVTIGSSGFRSTLTGQSYQQLKRRDTSYSQSRARP